MKRNKDTEYETALVRQASEWLRNTIWIPRYGAKGKTSRGPDVYARKLLDLSVSTPVRPKRLPYLRGLLTEISVVEILNSLVGDLGRASLSTDDIDKAGADIVVVHPGDEEIVMGGFDVKASIVRADESGHYIRTRLPFPVGTIGVDPEEIGVDDAMIDLAKGKNPGRLSDRVRTLLRSGYHQLQISTSLPYSVRERLLEEKAPPQRGHRYDLDDYMCTLEDRLLRWVREDRDWEYEPTDAWDDSAFIDPIDNY